MLKLARRRREAARLAQADADALVRRAASGASVFAAGSIQFSWGLDDWGWPDHADERLQRFMRNALAELAGKRT